MNYSFSKTLNNMFKKMKKKTKNKWESLFMYNFKYNMYASFSNKFFSFVRKKHG